MPNLPKEYLNQTKINLSSILFFILILALWFVQLAFTYQARFHYRFEDAGQNATSVIWFANREVSVITSTYFGWYALLHFVYSLFGFTINTAQYVRLAIHVVSLVCLGFLLKKYLGYNKALIPLIAIGLSPTLTYFTTSSAQYGLELQLLPICLLLLDSLKFSLKFKSIILEFLLWFLVMFGLLSFASFTFFVPGIALLFLIKLWPFIKKKQFSKFIFHGLVSAVAFFTPLAMGLLYFKNPKTLFYDPDIDLGGLFRSGSAVVFDLDVFRYVTAGSIRDVFFNGFSYYYQLKNGEFSHILPIIPFVLVLTLGAAWLNGKLTKRYVWLLLAVWMTIITNFLIANFGVDLSGLPGVRRMTPTLAAFYVLYTICCYKALTDYNLRSYKTKILIVVLLIIPIHHLLVLPDNYSHLPDQSLFGNDKRFMLYGTPQKYFEEKLGVVLKSDLVLDCREAYDVKKDACSYQNIFSTLTAFCMYNKLPCRQIYGYDPIVNRIVPLSVESLNILVYLR